MPEVGTMVARLILGFNFRTALLLIRVVDILNDCLALILSPLCFYSSGVDNVLLLVLLLIYLIIDKLNCFHVFVTVLFVF